MRIFRCKTCHHHLRYGRNVCSVCYSSSPIANRKWVLLTLLAVMVGLSSSLMPFFYSIFVARLDMIQPEPLFWQTMAV